MLFLVQGEVVKRVYMGRDSETKEIRIVEADNYDNAIQKFGKHFEDMGDSYSVYVRDCSEVITQGAMVMGKLGTTFFILNIICALLFLFSGNYPMMFVNGFVAAMMWHSARGL